MLLLPGARACAGRVKRLSMCVIKKHGCLLSYRSKIATKWLYHSVSQFIFFERCLESWASLQSSAIPSLVPRPLPLAYCERGSGDFSPLSWAFEVQVLRNTLINVVLECNDIAATISVQTLFSSR